MNPFSRRTFLKGLGAGAVATAAAGLRGLAAEQPADSRTLGPGEVEIVLDINGAPHTLRVEPRVTLLDALRNRLPYTAAKEVCDRGMCGACTVHLDGKPFYACMVLAVEAVGRKITTAEGLVKNGAQDIVQRAFIANDALMCGFCTPGFVMSARALLDENPAPSREQIVKACSGNLCRCGAYDHIVQAIQQAARGKAEVPS
jgi:xanthine dehydrogenase YagT iron-sulfur-binding subunit